MQIRQSDIQTWQRCPLQWRFRHIDKLTEGRSSAPEFGTCIHSAVEYLESSHDLPGALALFDKLWSDAEVDYFIARTSFKSYMDKGKKILKWWWDIVQWDMATVIVREHTFSVPLGRHTLNGTIDKLEIRYLQGGSVVTVVDYKTNAKLPTREYLRHNVQFTAYCYATTQPEFWVNIPNGDKLFEQYKSAPRQGEWVALAEYGGPKRVSADVRTQRDYNRLLMVVDNIEEAIGMGIYIPNLGGESCEYCGFREQCGLPSREEEGLAV